MSNEPQFSPVPAEEITLAHLADLRGAWDAAHDEKRILDSLLTERQADFNTENAPLIEKRADRRARFEAIDDDLRAAAERYYAANPTAKELIAGVSIQERRKVEYDPTAMFRWAIENAPFLLELNTVMVEQYVLGLIDKSTLKRDLFAHIQLVTSMPVEIASVPTAAISPTKTAKGDAQGA